MRAIAAALLLVLATPGVSEAQGWWWQFSYNMGATSGDTKDYVDHFSFRGVGFQGRKLMGFRSDWSLGFDVSWQVFAEQSSGTRLLDDASNSAISGTAYNYINAFPFLVSAHYYFGEGGRGATLGFVGLNAGPYYIERRTEAGLLAVTRDNWHFGVAPEVGVGIPTGSSLLTATARYNWTAEAGDLDYKFWTFAVGIASR